MLENYRVPAFTVSELLRENQQGEVGGRDNYSPLRLGSNEDFADACKWFVDNKLSIHFGGHKIKCILFSKGKYLSQLSLIYDRKKQFYIEEYLGCYLDANLSGCKVTVLL